MLIVLVGLALAFTIFLRLTPRRSAGIYVKLPLHVKNSQCGERRDIVMQISDDDTVRINSEAISSESLAESLRERYQVRVERVLFVKADPDVSFQKVIGAIDVARAAVNNLYVALLTPAVEQEPCLFIRAATPAPKLPGLP
jgi:biopolymer transport protein ExbD